MKQQKLNFDLKTKTKTKTQKTFSVFFFKIMFVFGRVGYVNKLTMTKLFTVEFANYKVASLNTDLALFF